MQGAFDGTEVTMTANIARSRNSLIEDRIINKMVRFTDKQKELHLELYAMQQQKYQNQTQKKLKYQRISFYLIIAASVNLILNLGTFIFAIVQKYIGFNGFDSPDSSQCTLYIKLKWNNFYAQIVCLCFVSISFAFILSLFAFILVVCWYIKRQNIQEQNINRKTTALDYQTLHQNKIWAVFIIKSLQIMCQLLFMNYLNIFLEQLNCKDSLSTSIIVFVGTNGVSFLFSISIIGVIIRLRHLRFHRQQNNIQINQFHNNSKPQNVKFDKFKKLVEQQLSQQNQQVFQQLNTFIKRTDKKFDTCQSHRDYLLDKNNQQLPSKNQKRAFKKQNRDNIQKQQDKQKIKQKQFKRIQNEENKGMQKDQKLVKKKIKKRNKKKQQTQPNTFEDIKHFLISSLKSLGTIKVQDNIQIENQTNKEQQAKNVNKLKQQKNIKGQNRQQINQDQKDKKFQQIKKQRVIQKLKSIQIKKKICHQLYQQSIQMSNYCQHNSDEQKKLQLKQFILQPQKAKVYKHPSQYLNQIQQAQNGGNTYSNWKIYKQQLINQKMNIVKMQEQCYYQNQQYISFLKNQENQKNEYCQITQQNNEQYIQRTSRHFKDSYNLQKDVKFQGQNQLEQNSTKLKQKDKHLTQLNLQNMFTQQYLTKIASQQQNVAVHAQNIIGSPQLYLTQQVIQFHLIQKQYLQNKAKSPTDNYIPEQHQYPLKRNYKKPIRNQKTIYNNYFQLKCNQGKKQIKQGQKLEIEQQVVISQKAIKSSFKQQENSKNTLRKQEQEEQYSLQ